MMKYETAWKMARWLCLTALLVTFSAPPVICKELVRIQPVVAPAQGADPMILTFNCIDGEPGDTICIPVTVENFDAIVGLQFEVIWDSDVLDYIRVQNPGSTNISITADFNQSGPNALKFIPLNLPPITGETLPDGAVLFEICFRVIGIPQSTSCIGVSPYFDYEVANVDSIIIADSIPCCMTVEAVVDLVTFVTSCGPGIPGNNGSIDITVYGGTGPYTITWVDFGGNPGGPVTIPVEGGTTSLSVLPGFYTITTTDALGTTVVNLTKVDVVGLYVNNTIKQPTCYKFENGIINIKPEGGSAPFSYIWESLTNPSLAGSGFIRNPGDSSKVTSLQYGIYSITVEDNNGCEVILLDTLYQNPYVFTIDTLINATCQGSPTGFIEISISGATPHPVDSTYTILVRPGFQAQSDMIALGLLMPGDYCITVTDEVAQCDTVYCFTIGYTDTISSTINTIDAPCAGVDEGTVILQGLTNGIPGPVYSYSIYQNANLITMQTLPGTFTYDQLAPGNYTAIVAEGPCLSDTIHFTIGEPPPIMITVDGLTPDNCLPTMSGDIWFNIVNGTPPYMLDVGAGFQDGDTIFNIGTGNHLLTVTDANGCEGTLAFYMPDGDDNEESDVSFVIDGIPCEGGTVIVLYQGLPIPAGVGVLWSNGMVNDTIEITGTDTLGVDVILGPPVFCILDDTVQIECDVVLDIDITVEQPLCGQGALGGPYTGTVIADTINATPPVTWYWSFPDTTTTGIYTGLAPGKYYVTVVDGLDSMAVDSFEIIAPPTLQLTFTNVDSTSCPGICDGSVRVQGANGDPTMDYFLYWDPLNPMADTGIVFNIAGLCEGFNVFTVSQDGNCFFIDSVEILAPDSVDISLVQVIDVSCYGLDDGSLEVIATGGTPGYTYDWNGVSTAPINTDLVAGYHSVTVTDSHNCAVNDSFLVVQPDTLIADIDTSGTVHLSCGASNDGVITIEVSGGNAGGYTFTWNPDVSNSYQAVNLTAGNYFVTVTDPKGCSDTASFTLTAPPPIAVTWPVVLPPACFGDVTQFQVDGVTGGSGTYSFSINSGNVYDIDEVVDLPAGIYIISVFDDRGCSADSTFIITEPNPILVSIGPDDPVVDLGDSLFITGTIVQSDNPIAGTLWTSDQPIGCETCDGTWVFNSLPAVYTWTVTDINGCTGSASIMVNVDYNRDVFVPTVFSPNNDGRNDEFSIFTGLGVTSINYLRIYDRWGNLVHEQGKMIPSPTGVGQWDGTYDGQRLNPGVYVYIAEISFLDGETLRFTGDITLIR